MDKVLYFPIRILLSFLIFTEVLFFIGPRIWDVDNTVLLISYLLCMNIVLYCGYRAGLKYSIRTAIGRFSLVMVKRIIIVAFFSKLIFFLLNNNFSISSIIGGLLDAANDFGQVYYNRDLEVNITQYLIGQVLSPVIFMGYVFGIYYWKELNKKCRAFCVLMIVIELISWISIGVRKGVCDILIIIFVSWLLRNYNVILNKHRLRKLKIYAVVCMVVFILFFLLTNLSRMSQYETFTEMLDETHVPIRSFYLEYVPKSMIMPIMSIASYLCQGYYALSKAFDVGIIYPNILGTNIFTVNVAEKFGYNPLEGSYLDLLGINYGISPTVNWHSIYVWLANGLTFFGVPFFVYFIGFLFGNSWKRAILRKDNVAMPLFVILFQMIFYFFANNQIFSFSFIAITCFIGLYIFNVGNKYVKKDTGCFS